MAKAPAVISGMSLYLGFWTILKPSQFSMNILPMMPPLPLTYLGLIPPESAISRDYPKPGRGFGNLCLLASRA